jgi:threonine/homoserine/homoserine lactone efflux protein
VSAIGHLPPGFEPAISLVGGIFLLYLAITAALNARRAAPPRASAPAARGGLLTGLLARGLSPHPYLFWFLVGGPTLVQAEQQVAGWAVAGAFLIGYYVMIVGSNVGLALVLHRWLGRLSGRLYRALLLLASLILAIYGLLLLDRAAQPRPVVPAR